MCKLKLYIKSLNKGNFGDLGFFFGKLCVMTLALSLQVKLEHDKGSKLGGCPRIQIYYFHLSVGFNARNESQLFQINSQLCELGILVRCFKILNQRL
jgi:hypothetical protein